MRCFNMGAFWVLEWEPSGSKKQQVKVFPTAKARQAFIREHGIQVSPEDQLHDDLDLLAIDFVVIERIPMRLTGNDRVEAIRRLSTKGLGPQAIGALMFVDGGTVSSIQATQGITPAPRPGPDPLKTARRRPRTRSTV